jgi:uncharacterized protein (DUF111 family)
MKSWTPAHFPSADQRNRSYDRKRSAIRWLIAAVAAFVAYFEIMKGPERDLQVVIANSEYEEEKQRARAQGWPCRVTLRKIERKYRLKAGSLYNYRTNHPESRVALHRL